MKLLSSMSVLILLLLLGALGCGSDGGGPSDPNDPPDDGGSDDGVMTAMIDGAAWTGVAATISATVDEDIPGGYIIDGTSGSGLGTRRMTINLYNIDEPGTYPLGVTASVFGGYATIAQTSGSIWYTAATGAAGQVTVTSLTASRIKGTFSFDASPFPFTPAMGTLVVTAGEFDVKVEGTAVPVPEGIGGELSAMFNGALFNASSALVTHNSEEEFFFSTLNDDFNVGIYLDGVTGPGVYPLNFSSPFRSAVVLAGSGAAEGTNCCWGANPGDAGSVTIATLTKRRITGSLEMTLVPQDNSPAAGPLVITKGSFDLGLDAR